MKLSTCAVAAIALLIAAPAMAQTAAPATTTITLKFAAEAKTGKVMVALFNSEAAYGGGGKPVAAAMVDVAGGKTDAIFEGLPAGDYAAKAFHDVDGDGKMNTNPFGMPTEPFAFSNNAVGNMGPAKWERAHFAASGAVAQTITLR